MTPLITPRYANGWGKRVFQLAVFSILIKEKPGLALSIPVFYCLTEMRLRKDIFLIQDRPTFR